MMSSERVEDGTIERIESELRRVKRTLVATLVGVAAALSLTAATHEPGRTLEVDTLVLRDRQGSARASLSLQDGRGTPRLGFALSPEGPGFRLYDAEGGRRVVLGVAAQGVLTDATGEKLASLP